MNIYRWMLVVPAVGVTMAIGFLSFSKLAPRNGSDPEQIIRDPLLQELQALNPDIVIVDEFARVPIYWIKLPDKTRILFPRSEAEAARLRLHDCDIADISPAVLYPKRTTMACLDVDNPSHKLEAYFFRTKDRMKPVVAYFESPLAKERRFGTSHSQVEERREVLDREDGTKEFQFSYFLWEGVDTVGFVGYREEKK